MFKKIVDAVFALFGGGQPSGGDAQIADHLVIVTSSQYADIRLCRNTVDDVHSFRIVLYTDTSKKQILKVSRAPVPLIAASRLGATKLVDMIADALLDRPVVTITEEAA